MKKIIYSVFILTLFVFSCAKTNDEDPAPEPDPNSVSDYQAKIVGTWEVSITSTRYNDANVPYEVPGVFPYKLVFKADGTLTLQSYRPEVPSPDRTFTIVKEDNKFYVTFSDADNTAHKYEITDFRDSTVTLNLTEHYSPGIEGIGIITPDGKPYIYTREEFKYYCRKTG